MENRNNDLMELLEGRRTYRRFDESRPIPDSVVDKIKRAARLASSAANRQPLRYIYVRDVETVNALFELTAWAGAIPNGEGVPKVGERPTMFAVVLLDKSIKSRYASFDAGLAVSNMTLAAWEEGVGSCIIGSLMLEKLRALLGISDDFDISVAVAFGYPTHKSSIVDSDGGNVTYYIDEYKDYFVPKRKDCDTVRDV